MIAVALRIAVVASLALAVCLRAPPAAAETIGGWYLLTFEDGTQANGTRAPPSHRHQLAVVSRTASAAQLYILQARGALGSNVPIVGRSVEAGIVDEIATDERFEGGGAIPDRVRRRWNTMGVRLALAAEFGADGESLRGHFDQWRIRHRDGEYVDHQIVKMPFSGIRLRTTVRILDRATGAPASHVRHDQTVDVELRVEPALPAGLGDGLSLRLAILPADRPAQALIDERPPGVPSSIVVIPRAGQPGLYRSAQPLRLVAPSAPGETPPTPGRGSAERDAQGSKLRMDIDEALWAFADEATPARLELIPPLVQTIRFVQRDAESFVAATRVAQGDVVFVEVEASGDSDAPFPVAVSWAGGTARVFVTPVSGRPRIYRSAPITLAAPP